jgi:hypothetical protein
MPALEARIETARAGRYLAQLCKHAAAMGSARGHRLRAHPGGQADAPPAGVQPHAEWSGTGGVISFGPAGRCTVRAGENMLTVRAEAATDQDLRWIQQVITRDLGRFGRRDNLTVTWAGCEDPADGPD